jgi:hypothetical protein
MGIRCADHVTPLYPQKLALTSPTGGGRSVGIVRSRTKATEFFYINNTYSQLPHNVMKGTEYFVSLQMAAAKTEE